MGKSPDWRAQDTMKKHDVPYTNHARQIVKEDFYTFDFIFGMDEENMTELARRAPKDGKAKLLMLGEFDPQGERIIRDPYFVSILKKIVFLRSLNIILYLQDAGSEGFEKCYQQCMRACGAFLDQQTC